MIAFPQTENSFRSHIVFTVPWALKFVTVQQLECPSWVCNSTETIHKTNNSLYRNKFQFYFSQNLLHFWIINICALVKIYNVHTRTVELPSCSVLNLLKFESLQLISSFLAKEVNVVIRLELIAFHSPCFDVYFRTHVIFTCFFIRSYYWMPKGS